MVNRVNSSFPKYGHSCNQNQKLLLCEDAEDPAVAETDTAMMMYSGNLFQSLGPHNKCPS